MAELVDELVDMGYVVRRPDPNDGKAKLIVLTKRGRDGGTSRGVVGI
jgi:DNA-binding MarR family transcriptional regulator